MCISQIIIIAVLAALSIIALVLCKAEKNTKINERGRNHRKEFSFRAGRYLLYIVIYWLFASLLISWVEHPAESIYKTTLDFILQNYSSSTIVGQILSLLSWIANIIAIAIITSWFISERLPEQH